MSSSSGSWFSVVDNMWMWVSGQMSVEQKAIRRCMQRIVLPYVTKKSTRESLRVQPERSQWRTEPCKRDFMMTTIPLFEKLRLKCPLVREKKEFREWVTREYFHQRAIEKGKPLRHVEESKIRNGEGTLLREGYEEHRKIRHMKHPLIILVNDMDYEEAQIPTVRWERKLKSSSSSSVDRSTSVRNRKRNGKKQKWTKLF